MRLDPSLLWTWNRTIDRGPYLLTGALLFLFKFAIDWTFATRVFDRPWSPFYYLVWPNDRVLRVFALDSAERAFSLTMLGTSLPFIWVGVMLTLHRLRAAGCGFISISEAMDFTTAIGQVILATLAAFAEYYSANLSNETRKGKTERKRQGLYNGVLPFGATKRPDGVPTPHSEAHGGLVLAFELAAAGKTDREIAQGLNAAGYRTTGNRGANPFTKDTVRPMLQNRFYLGELPDGKAAGCRGATPPSSTPPSLIPPSPPDSATPGVPAASGRSTARRGRSPGWRRVHPVGGA